MEDMTNWNLSISFEDDFQYESQYEINLSDNTNYKPFYALVILTVINTCIFVVGLTGNIITCIVIACNKSMHTTTNCYLFNLAISDLLLLIAGVPHEIYAIWNTKRYLYGRVGCFWHYWTSETSIIVSNLTVTAFTVERYVAICRPFVMQVMSQIPRTRKLIAAIWVIALLSSFGLVWQTQFMDIGDLSTCAYFQNIIPYYLEISTLVFYIFPMTSIAILYAVIGVKLVKSSRMQKIRGDEIQNINTIDSSTKRVLKMLVTVVTAFFICWTPFHAQRVFSNNAHLFFNETSMKKLDLVLIILFYISGILYFLSAAINPIIYNTMSNKFRNAFKETLSKGCNKLRLINIWRFTSTNAIKNNVVELADTPL